MFVSNYKYNFNDEVTIELNSELWYKYGVQFFAFNNVNNFKLASELGAEIIKVKSRNVAKTISDQAEERSITTICIGKPHLSLIKVILASNVFNELLKKLSTNNIDLVILS